MESTPPLDPRAALFVTYSQGSVRQVTREDLVRHAAGWPVTSATPDGVAGLLKTSRDIYCLAVYTYELFAVASVWSLLAIEAGLRIHYDNDKATLEALINRAKTDSLLDEQSAQSLHAARRLRNDLFHPRQQDIWTPGMAAGTIRATHSEIAALFPDESDPARGA